MKKSNNGNSKYTTLTKNMALFTISSFGSKILSFLLVPLYTQVFSTQEFGTADLLTSTVALLIPILTINIQDAVLRFTLDKDYSADDVISTGIRINFAGSILLLMALIVLKWTRILQLDVSLVMFLFFSFVFGSLNNCFTLYLKGKNKVPVLVVSGLLNTILVCALNILLLAVFSTGILGYLIASVAGVVAAVGYQFFAGRIYKDIRLKKFTNLSMPMLKYSGPLIANSLAWWVNGTSGRYILTLFSGVAANGVFSIAYKIPTMLSTIQSIFYNAWSISAITEFDANDKDGFIGKTYTMYSSISLLGCSLIMLLNIPLARLLYSGEFFMAWQCVPFLLVGTAFNGIALFQGCIFVAVKDTKEVSKTTIVGACVNMLCNVVLIYFIGALGAALAAMFAYIVTYVMRAVKLVRIIKMKVNWKNHICSCALLLVQAIFSTSESTVFLQTIVALLLLALQWKVLEKMLIRLRKWKADKGGKKRSNRLEE